MAHNLEEDEIGILNNAEGIAGKNMVRAESSILSVENVGTHRKLKARHIQMIAIGGTIGTGLFLGSGKTLALIGPLGTLLTFLLAGIIVFCVIMSLGEMATMIPVTGSFNEYVARFHSPALGFTSAWAYWFNWAMTLPIEIQACGDFLGFWFPKVPPIQFYMILLLVLLMINLFTVSGFGEVEYWLSLMKIVAILIFIIAGLYLVMDQNLGFKNYDANGGPFAGQGFWGIVAALPNAVFAFGGTELVGITAGEAANPRKSVPAAIKGTFWRIMIFYILSIFTMGLALPSNYASGMGDSNKDVLGSPFVAVMEIANIPGAAHFINFIAFVAVFSAGNSSLYASSRTMMSLCQKGYGPSILSGINKSGVPVLQLFISASFGLITILTTVVGVGVIFQWLMSLVGNLIGVSWLFISIAHIYFRKAYAAQGYKLENLPYQSPIGTVGDYVALFFNGFVLVFAGITPYVMGKPFDLLECASNYMYLFPLIVLYSVGVYKYGYHIVPSEKVDLQTGHVGLHDMEYEMEAIESTSMFGKVVDWIS
ncbi:lysine-specific permease [Globomyces pollinis-pini]|nr:lysine-specific permease [Globomyces pollinis-pini]